MRPTAPFGVVRRLAQTASTMEEARRLALEGAPEGACVVAETQTAGRGRDGRPWQSPPGGLYVSVVVRPSYAPSSWGLLPLAAGLALQEAVAPHAPAARLKWPNDVLVHGAKLGGVLVEARPPDFAVVGLGANVGTVASALPPGATSLRVEGARLARDTLLAALLERLRARFADLEEGRAADVRAAWEARAGMLGRRVAVGGRVGVAVGLAEDGGLVVEGDGGRVTVRVGDVALP